MLVAERQLSQNPKLLHGALRMIYLGICQLWITCFWNIKELLIPCEGCTEFGPFQKKKKKSKVMAEFNIQWLAEEWECEDL